MALRSFVDSAKREWVAFDVVPRAKERRNYDRRRTEPASRDSEERRATDRRLTVGGAAAISGTGGWLCFESGDARRRLAPIPDGWTRASDETLEAYCKAARPARISQGVARVDL